MGDVVKLRERDWRKGLCVTLEGKTTKDPGNALILLTHGKWQGCLAYDEFADRTYWAAEVPTIDNALIAAPRVGEEVCERHSIYLQHWFALNEGVKFTRETMLGAVDAAAHTNTICPPRAYLKALKWDKTKRLATMFEKYFGADATPYAASVGTWWMISAVARVLEPGCKADCILILQGKQGAKKSTALHVLGGEWYSNSLPDVTSKDAALAMFGSWIIEIPELEAMNRSATTAFKDFSARTFDKYRPPYGRFQVTKQRTSVFAGTTNEDKILNDPTGARRFWPVKVGSINLDALRRDRDQLWAEAVQMFQDGEQWWPTNSMADIVSAEQDERFADDAWTIPIANWLHDQEECGLEDFTTIEIMQRALCVPVDKVDAASATRVGKILRRLNYEHGGRRTIGGRKYSVYSTKKPGLVLKPPREPGDEG
jgi:predicted P-loop ATPase